MWMALYRHLKRLNPRRKKWRILHDAARGRWPESGAAGGILSGHAGSPRGARKCFRAEHLPGPSGPLYICTGIIAWLVPDNLMGDVPVTRRGKRQCTTTSPQPSWQEIQPKCKQRGA